MKIKIFDVIELENGNKATVLDIDKGIYKIDEIDEKGNQLRTREVSIDEIKKVIYTKR